MSASDSTELGCARVRETTIVFHGLKLFHVEQLRHLSQALEGFAENYAEL